MMSTSQIKLILLIGAGVIALYIASKVYNASIVASDDVMEEIENNTKKEKQENEENEEKEEDDMKEEEEEKKDILNSISFPVQVFVRMRPLVGLEVTDNDECIKYNVKKLKKKKTKTLTLKKVYGRNNERDKIFKGFKNILLPNNDNIYTFNHCILPTCIASIFCGEKVCVFAYGHTGSGKTHTMFGYNKENIAGIYQLFAEKIFDDKRIKDADDIFIEIRFTELYQGKLRDLLSDTKQECFVREVENGDINIRANPVKCDDGKIRQYPITGIHVQNENELFNVVGEAIKSRNVGNSSIHDKSSRSHAFLEFEIVSNELINQRELLIEKEAELLTFENEAITVPRKYVKKMKQEIEGIKDIINKICNNDDIDRSYIGGTMICVDLAGNEYGRDVKNDTKQEERERIEINKSLMSLKECIRGIHSKNDYIGYRNSKLTMYLRKYLRGIKTKAIMIANIGPSKQYVKQTINTLQYSQLVAKA